MISASPARTSRADAQRRLDEIARCMRDPAYFVGAYCQLYDATSGEWLPFDLWPAQRRTLATIAGNDLLCILKARQLGLTWLVLAYSLWLMLFQPAATVLLFSRRDIEAVELLDKRLKGMYSRLPSWLQCKGVPQSAGHEWELSNGSRALAFPTTGGRSYTATLAIVDEADFAPDLGDLLNAVKPTVDAGGKLILLSTADKSRPESTFKRIYTAARRGETDYTPVFLSWRARPDRTEAWYAAQAADVQARTGSLDDLHQEYPANDAEALAPRSLDKRIPPEWLARCYVECTPLAEGELPDDAPALPGLAVFSLPLPDHEYAIGADPAEGNPASDDSAAVVLDRLTGEEAASIAGHFEPATFAGILAVLAEWYNDAPVLVERNNHGHAVLLALRDYVVVRMMGWDGKPGWLTTGRGKALLYSELSESMRDGALVVHALATQLQLASIDGSTLSAPQGQHDDRAMAYALAAHAITIQPPPDAQPGHDPFARREATGPGVVLVPTLNEDGGGSGLFRFTREDARRRAAGLQFTQVRHGRH